ncbi:hypothetical protein [Paenibacillus ginsengarvi]|uniref:hypothetical protein n=1 Tax=Paenibacillus ginsengarvi TaxID=400777 RepID=UPI0011C4003A|nr:hypothetical protein [Paenibacillus ginsengarvi]
MIEQVTTNPDWKLLFPVDGDMLNERDGDIRDGRLHIIVSIEAPDGSLLRVNGVSAQREEDGIYKAPVSLDGYRNAIVVTEEVSGRSESLEVIWLKQASSKYRLSLDDNIWCLKDIAENAHVYRSIFENPYLALYKEAHDTYGTKVHINIYYQTEGFDLSQMPDKFKEEWKANAHWLRLTFHAMQNDPDKPYIAAPAEEVIRDCERVTSEIIRFAGKELLDPVTTIHWGEATRESCRALRKLGFRGLAGYFRFGDGKPIVSYYLDDEQTAHLAKRDFWKDRSEDLVFIKIDAVLDKLDVEQIVPELDRLKESPHESGFIELLIHEQYFYPFYRGYQPEYRNKIMTAAKWASENGYEPSFLSEIGLFE